MSNALLAAVLVLVFVSGIRTALWLVRAGDDLGRHEDDALRLFRDDERGGR